MTKLVQQRPGVWSVPGALRHELRNGRLYVWWPDGVTGSYAPSEWERVPLDQARRQT